MVIWVQEMPAKQLLAVFMAAAGSAAAPNQHRQSCYSSRPRIRWKGSRGSADGACRCAPDASRTPAYAGGAGFQLVGEAIVQTGLLCRSILRRTPGSS